MATLHENILTRLKTSPSGKIYDSDLAEIYSLLIICLDLKDDAKRKGGFGFGLLKAKTYAYLFTVSTALLAMTKLKLVLDLNNTSTSMSYCISECLGKVLISKFYAAKLLHSPMDRTRSEPKASVPLQPTPKGVCILQDFVERVGMDPRNYPSILYSIFNSMYLLKVERDLLTDKILYSKYFINLIFIAMMGEEPNVWSAEDAPEKLPSLRKKLRMPNRSVGVSTDNGGSTVIESESESKSKPKPEPRPEPESYASKLKTHYQLSDSNQELGLTFNYIAPPPPPGTGSLLALLVTSDESIDSSGHPFFHKYFSNPESDSHVQYYTSASGVRVFPLRTFYDTQTEVIVQHYISGKAILQWLCDCVCIYSENQGIGIAGLFLQLRLIEPIMLPPSIANYEKFNPSRNSFYKLTKLGLSVCHWNSSSVEVVNFSDDDDDDHDDGESLTFDSDTLIPTRDSSSRSNITLSMVLKDPGLRYLFKTHLEMEFCSENLQVFILLKDFKYSMKTLDKLFQTLPKVKDNAKLKIKLLQSIQKQLNTLKSMSYHIHFQYLTADAPNVLNLDLKLRDKVIHNMNERDEINEDVTQGEEDLLLREYDGITRKYEIFNEISNSVFRLMEIDSLPKFLNGKVYTKAMMTLDLIVE